MLRLARFVSVVLLTTLAYAQTTIAVIDFEARNISAGEVATLTDRFRDELTKTNQYTVIERGKMEEVLREQGFQQSGCTSDECVVEVGQLVGVQQMVGGSIGKVGNVFTLSARIINVESGTILNVTNYDHSGDIGGLLTIGMRDAVRQLLEGKSAKPSQNFEDVVKAKEYTSPPIYKQTGTIIDIDGNVYNPVKIGDQWWMAENLKVTRYRNGDQISTGHSKSEWKNLSTGAYAVYNDVNSNADTYGYLYNWYAVDDSRNIAPEGWHVPTDDEWKELEMFLGMIQSEADDTGWRGTNEGSMLAGRADLWNDGALENDSEFGISGFSALPGGYRNNYGNYYYMGYGGYFWSATEGTSSTAWHRGLNYSSSDISRGSSHKVDGFSIRCIRD